MFLKSNILKEMHSVLRVYASDIHGNSRARSLSFIYGPYETLHIDFIHIQVWLGFRVTTLEK